MLSYPAIRLRGAPESLELALALLVDHGCLGTEEVSEECLLAYLPQDFDMEPLLTELSSKLPAIEAQALPPVLQRDWLSEWKASFKGFALGESFFVLPTWKPAPETERSVLVLDPEQAFGTGTHDTTRLAAELLERFVRPGESVLDLGAGTGILAMMAARLGAAPVTAVEIDPAAADCARENAARNGLSESVRVLAAGAESLEGLGGDLLVANITAPALERILPRVRVRRLVLSGILAEELDDFLHRLPSRLRPVETWTSGEWAALVFADPEAP